MKNATFDVVMLSTAHPATNHRIFYREAKTLADRGFKVAVVARHPKSEIVDHIPITALPTAKTRIKRLLLGWAALQAALRVNGRVYIFHDPELFGIGLLLRVLGRKVIYDAHENLPKLILQKDWLPLPLRYMFVPAVWLMEWIGSRLLSGVMVAVPAMQRRFPASHTILVRNFPTGEALQALASDIPLSRRKNVVIYAGGLTEIRGIRELVRAFEGTENAELWLVGGFDSTIFKNEVLSQAPPNVRWLGSKPHPELLELYGEAKLGVSLLYPTPNHRMSLPVKLFEYLAAGLPVIASNFPEFEEIMKGCGVQVDPHSVADIRSAIQQLLASPAELEKMSERGRQRVLSSFSWEPEGERLVTLCARLTGRRPIVYGGYAAHSVQQAR